ncbi:MAG: DUF368 domain-containing protein [Chloroflexota bacterium]
MSTLQSNATHSVDEQIGSRTIWGYLILVAKGFCMGCADVVPGVSGGTMAFILGIYEELLSSIRMVGRPQFIQAVLGFRVKDAVQIINLPFLIAIIVGILIAILTLAPGLEWLLENEPVLLWSFFFGLVIASILSVSRRVTTWTPILWGMLVVGAVLAWLLVGLTPTQTPESWWFLMLSGAIAICAMILPGVSGSFILVLMSKYQFFIEAVNSRDLISLALAGIGALVGLVSFAQILSWLFKRYHDMTVALLIGLMVGSLRKIWPWKEVLETMTDRHGKLIPIVEQNVLPISTKGTFSIENLTNGSFQVEFIASVGSSVGNMEILYAVGLAILGFVLVMLLERLGNAN